MINPCRSIEESKNDFYRLCLWPLLTTMVLSTEWRTVGAVALLASLVSATFPDCTSFPLKDNAVCDNSLNPVARATALIDALTLAEKINLTQYNSPGVPRLGLPAYGWWSEGLHGVAYSPGVNFSSSGDFSYATSFPQPILMSAAFDDALIKAVGSVVSTEARAFDNVNRAGLDYWTPNINPFKDPRWGRGQETPGEDPFHIQNYVYNLIDGLQNGIGPENPKIVATCKHFAAYDLENWEGNERYGFNAVVTTQDLSEYYLPPFKTCARDAKVNSLMCSYNAVNGIPSCADPFLMETILRDHWQWNETGHYVTSDCDAIQNIYANHHYTSTAPEAAADGLIAGCDLDCGSTYPDYLGPAYTQGLYQISTLNTALIRMYEALVRLGWFDPAGGQPYRSLGWSDVSTPAAEQLALTAAVEGITLLKNDNKNVLPLSKKVKTIALIGPWANASTQMQGNYQGAAPYLISPLDGAEHHGFKALYAEGTAINSTNTTGFAAALSAAKAADVIIFAGGIDDSIEAEGNDRNTIIWPGNQLDLIQQLSQVGKPFVVLQFGGGQVDDTSIFSNENVNALLWSGYPGQSGGLAIFNILTGSNAPAGRLPITQYPANYVDEVPMTNMNLRPGTGNPGRTYRWYSDAVIPFGYGLHYTTFELSFTQAHHGGGSSGSFSISALQKQQQASHASHPDLAPFTTFTVNVKNTGHTATSDYVALLFAKTSNAGPAPYPLKTLVGYTRATAIRPGETRAVPINVSLGSIARTDGNGNLVLYPGTYELEVDVGVEGVPSASATFTITGKEWVLDEFPQPPASGPS
jgi:beta-D-xylosidase 4